MTNDIAKENLIQSITFQVSVLLNTYVFGSSSQHTLGNLS